MPPAPGARLGPYDIVSKLGAGGMGEVYRAHDPRLGRDVALKVLPESVAADPERLARFEREAKALAAFTHQHIATLFAFEQLDGQPVLIMELVEGQTLEDAIASNFELRSSNFEVLEWALPLATQIAVALEAAHAKGIVHRDLKPANIKVTPDGQVKVLDFGLAKAAAPDAASGSADAMNSPTLTAQATAAGIILGTAAYMAPEQARGRAADKRADIWAFGVVMLEMLTGRRLFAGETISDTLAAVLRQDIDLDGLPAGTPAELKRLLRRCLERDPKNRLQDIGDARIVLDEISRGGMADETPPPAVSVSQTPAVGVLIGAVAAALVLGALGGWAWNRTAESAAEAPVVRLAVPAPTGVTSVQATALSPDGSFVVFQGQLEDGRPQLFLRQIHALEAEPIPGTEGGTSPMVSPDGRWIAFQRSNRLEKIAVAGGEALRLADRSSNTPGATWARDDTLVVTPSWLGGLMTVDADGGPMAPLTTPDAANGEKGHWWPRVLPGGRHVLFTIWREASGLNDADLAVIDLDTREYRTIMRGADGWYVDPGFLVFFRTGAYQAVRFDLDTLTPTGEPVTVLTDDRGNVPEGDGTTLSLSANGTLAYVPGSYTPDAQLAWLSPDGAIDPLPFPVRAYGRTKISADGHTIAADVQQGGAWSIRLLNLDRNIDDVLDMPGSNWEPLWSPTGRRLAFVSMRKGDFDVYVKDVESPAPPAEVLVSAFDDQAIAWMADDLLAVEQSGEDGRFRIKAVRLGDPDSLVLLSDNLASGLGSTSPDGQWLAFTTNPGGRSDVYARRNTTDEAALERVSTAGGEDPVFAKNGRELFYRRGQDIIVAIYQTDGGRFRVTGERVVARTDSGFLLGLDDVAADGRLLVRMATPAPPPPQVRVVVNWAEELARAVER